MQNARRIFAFMDGPLHSVLAASVIMTSICICASAPSAAQETEGPALVAAPVVPQQVRYAGKLAARTGETVEAEFRIYAAAEGGDPLWTETQRVAVVEDGSYSVLLGAASTVGLPQTVFAGGAARWLGVSVERSAEQERVLLSSVPYAMKSADAESLAGHAASDFVTQEQLAHLSQLTQSAASSRQKGIESPAVQPDTGGTVTGSGTAGSVPLWTGTLTQGNSEIVQVGSDIGINEVAPAATLDVNGTTKFRGAATLAASGTATASSNYISQPLYFTANEWSTTTHAPINTSMYMYYSPTGALRIASQLGTAPATNVLSIGSNGVIAFAPTQTFPGAIASVTGTSPVTATTTSGAVGLGLNMAALETTLNALYPQLGTGNVFQSYIEAVQSAGPLGAAVIGAGTSESTGVLGASDTGIGVYGNVTTPKNGESGVLGSTGSAFVFSNTSTNLGTTFEPMVTGVWGDTTGNPNPGIDGAAGVLGTADNALAGAFFNNSPNLETLFVEALGSSGAIVGQAATGYGVTGYSASGAGIDGEVTSGDGVRGTSDTGYGVYAGSGTGIGVYGQSTGNTPGTARDGVSGVTLTPSKGSAGVLGNAYTTSSSYVSLENAGFVAGVWGDSANPNDGSGYNPAGIIGTADDHAGGIFLNNSSTHTTVSIVNFNSSGGTGLFRTFSASTPHGTCGIGGAGDLTCTGQVKTLATTGGGARTVETYSTQSAENWMEDYGSGTLEKGVGVVKIDPTFAETVSETADYHVFLTPNADSKGLYVINKTPTSFEVRESGGGTSSLTFDYKIVAKRRGYEGVRLRDVTEGFKAAKASTVQAQKLETTPLQQSKGSIAPAPAPKMSGAITTALGDPER